MYEVKKALNAILAGYAYGIEEDFIWVENPTYDPTAMDDPNLVFYPKDFRSLFPTFYSIKQVILLRKDLKMRRGKEIAQGAHASMGACLKSMEDPITKAWLAGKFTKIALYVNSLDEMLLYKEKADKLGCTTCLITDSGLTEFNGVPTVTALAIGPEPSFILDKITGHLVLC